jgi:hypothetical protein
MPEGKIKPAKAGCLILFLARHPPAKAGGKEVPAEAGKSTTRPGKAQPSKFTLRGYHIDEEI